LYSRTLVVPQETAAASRHAMTRNFLIFVKANKNTTFFVPLQPKKVGRSAAPLSGGEESPDRKGRRAAESADGSNLMGAVTEKNRRKR